MDIELSFLPHLVDLESMKACLEAGVRSMWFSDETIAEMYEYSLSYVVRSGFEHAPSRELLEEDWGPFIAKRGWPESSPIVGDLIDRQRERHRRSRSQKVLLESAAMVLEDPDEAIQFGITGLIDIQMDTGTRDRLTVYGEDFDRRLEEYERINQAGSDALKDPGVAFMCDEVTEAIHGIRPTEVAVLGGYAKKGKSWALCKIAAYAALCQRRVYFPSLENNPNLTLKRIDCVISGVPFSDYDNGTLSLDDYKKLEAARERIEGVHDLLIVDSPRRRRERSLVELYSRARFHGAELLVGDQISHVHHEGRYSSDRSERTAEVVTDISDLSKEMNLASVWASQMSRESERVKRPRADHYAWSSLIEQTVDFAFVLWRDEDQAARDVMTLSMLATRRTKMFDWYLHWQLENQTYLGEVIRVAGINPPSESMQRVQRLAAGGEEGEQGGDNGSGKRSRGISRDVDGAGDSTVSLEPRHRLVRRG